MSRTKFKIIISIFLVFFSVTLSVLMYLNSGLPFKSYFLKQNSDLGFLSDMSLVKEYNFNESTISENDWASYGVKRRRAGWWNDETIEFKNGYAIFNAKYYENGISGTYWNKNKEKVESPSGFYAGGIRTTDVYKYGYFEAKMKMPKMKNSWGAFWITTESLNSDDATMGTEIDIAESSEFEFNIIRNALYYNYPNLQSRFKLNYFHNIYTDYVTYGLLWTKDSYTFYINGNQYFTSNFGGVSQIEQFKIGRAHV